MAAAASHRSELAALRARPGAKVLIVGGGINGVATFRSGFDAYEARLSGGDAPRLEGTVDVVTTNGAVHMEDLAGAVSVGTTKT